MIRSGTTSSSPLGGFGRGRRIVQNTYAWILNPGQPSLLVLRLVQGGYEMEARVAGSQVFATEWPFPFRVVPADLNR